MPIEVWCKHCKISFPINSLNTTTTPMKLMHKNTPAIMIRTTCPGCNKPKMMPICKADDFEPVNLIHRAPEIKEKQPA